MRTYPLTRVYQHLDDGHGVQYHGIGAGVCAGVMSHVCGGHGPRDEKGEGRKFYGGPGPAADIHILLPHGFRSRATKATSLTLAGLC